MKTILVDAVNAFVSEEGVIFEDMFNILQSFENPKIIVTGAPKDMFPKYGLDKVQYEVFTLQHNPEKTDSEYFRILLREHNLQADDVVYFDHNSEAVTSAEIIGITAYHYDHTQKDLTALVSFLVDNL